MQRRAFEEAQKRKPSAAQCAVDLQCLGGVVRAGRVKPATASGPKNDRQRGRKRFLVNTHEREEHVTWETDEPENNFFEEAIHGV